MNYGERRELETNGIAYVHGRVARWLAVAALAVYAIPIGMLIHERILPSVPAPPPSMWVTLLGQVSAGAAALLLAAIVLRAFPRESRGVLTRVGDRLVVETAGLLGRRKLRMLVPTTGCLVPDGKRTRAEMGLANGDMLQVTAPDFAAAIEVLRLAGVDAAKQHARFRVDDLMSRVFAYMITASVIGIVTLPLAFVVGAALWGVCAAALIWAASGFVTLPQITVGTDGIAYKRGPFRYFIPLSQIKEVRSSDVTLSVHLRDGRVKKIRSLAGADPGRAYSLELRVREALAASRGEHAPAQLEMLERRGKSVADWTVSLAGLTRAGASYRAVGLSADDLDAIVASPDVSPERRIGAALALRGAGHPAAGDRIRVAAAQCASARLRIALERVGEGAVDVEAIAEALAETEAFAQEAEAEARTRTPSA